MMSDMKFEHLKLEKDLADFIVFRKHGRLDVKSPLMAGIATDPIKENTAKMS